MNGSNRFEHRDQPCSVCGGVLRTYGLARRFAHHDGQGERIALSAASNASSLSASMPFPRGDLAGLYPTLRSISASTTLKRRRDGAESCCRNRAEDWVQDTCSIWIAPQRITLGGARSRLEHGRVDPSPAHLEWARLSLGLKRAWEPLMKAGFPTRTV